MPRRRRAGPSSWLAGALPRVRWMASWVGLAALGSAVSPFQHVPEVPAAGFDAVPLVGLTVGALALAGVGLAAFRRRDLTT